MNSKATTVFLLSCATFVTVLGYSSAQGSSGTNEPAKVVDYRLFETISSNATQALYYMMKCNESLIQLLAISPDKVTSAFIASKMAWVEGRPTDAIAILDNVIQNNGESNSFQFGLPVAVLGNFWIGAISRHFGDVTRAQKAYTDIGTQIASDPKIGSLIALVYLYQAEMEDQTLGHKSAAIASLKKIKEIKPPADRNSGYAIYQEWTDYQMAVLTKGVQEARLSLKGSTQKTGQCIMLVMSQLGVNGICGEPRVGFYNDERKIILEKALDMAIECRTSPIDRSLAQFFLARMAEEKRDMAKAEKYYGDLLSGDSYFAPEGGVNLARFQKKQGKKEESRKTFIRVKERFPGYAKLVEDLSER